MFAWLACSGMQKLHKLTELIGWFSAPTILAYIGGGFLIDWYHVPQGLPTMTLQKRSSRFVHQQDGLVRNEWLMECLAHFSRSGSSVCAANTNCRLEWNEASMADSKIRNRRGLRFEDGGKTLHERVQPLFV